MINEIISDIIHDLIMNIDNRNLNDEELTIHGDINNNHETINNDDDVILVANYTQADSSYEPEVITLSSDEEDMKAPVKPVPTFIIVWVSRMLRLVSRFETFKIPYHGTSYGHLKPWISYPGYRIFSGAWKPFV